jgi:hypothetical protein
MNMEVNKPLLLVRVPIKNSYFFNKECAMKTIARFVGKGQDREKVYDLIAENKADQVIINSLKSSLDLENKGSYVVGDAYIYTKTDGTPDNNKPNQITIIIV